MNVKTNIVEFVDGREYPIKGWAFGIDKGTDKLIITFFIDECDSFMYTIDEHILERKGIGDDHFYEETEIRAFYINGTKYECRCELKPKAKYSTYAEYRKKPKVLIPEIEKVIFNPPATIIMWKDNTKTVVKCGENEMYDPEFGMAMAISKKALGNQGSYYDTFRKPCGDYWQKEFDEQFIEAVCYHLDGFKHIHPITLDYTIGWVLMYVEGYDELSQKEKERLRKLAWKEVPKAYSDWNTYVENNEEGAWREREQIKEFFDKVEKVESPSTTPIKIENVEPKYDTNPKKDDDYIDIKPEEHIGDNSYDRWIKNTPFAEKIKARREAMSMSQKDVAAKVGVGKSTYRYWDSGFSRPSKEEHRQKLAEVLKFKLEELYEVERDLDGNVISTKVIK